MTRSLRIIVALAFTGLTTALISAPAQAQDPTDSLEVILAIDTSESMTPALEAAKIAANEFISAMPSDVRIGLETFADQVTVLTPPTTDRALLAAQIGSIFAAGDTVLYDVVVGAASRFTPTVENKVLVILSDGMDEGSVATLDDAIAAAQSISVETISLTTLQTDLASLTALGPVTSADDPAAVSSAFASRRPARRSDRAHAKCRHYHRPSDFHHCRCPGHDSGNGRRSINYDDRRTRVRR